MTNDYIEEVKNEMLEITDKRVIDRKKKLAKTFFSNSFPDF